MNYTTYTAIVITLHHWSALLSLIIAVALSSLIFWLFLSRRRHRAILGALTFLLSIIVGASFAEEVLLQPPFQIELITAG